MGRPLLAYERGCSSLSAVALEVTSGRLALATHDNPAMKEVRLFSLTKCGVRRESPTYNAFLTGRGNSKISPEATFLAL